MCAKYHLNILGKEEDPIKKKGEDTYKKENEAHGHHKKIRHDDHRLN